MLNKIKELLESYRRMHMKELLTESAERIAYLEGVIDGLELALEVVKGDDSGKN